MGTNTGVGIGIGIPFKNNALGGDRPYLPPELKARLIGVWDNYGKKNTDADRNIIKNKIPNAGGDLEILNAAYKLNSGFGKYKEDFTSWRIYPNIEVTDNVITTNGNFNLTWFIYKHSSESKINEMNIKVSGIPKGGKILYLYISDETANLPIAYTIPKDGIYHLPESKINNNRVSVGFTVESRYDWNNIRIEQIPSFEGAFVTDGIDDLITSTKTVQEMLGGSNEITVVSMIHQIGFISSRNYARNNYFIQGNDFLTNTISAIGKIGIYGYKGNLSNIVIVNDILGDKKDYSVDKANPANIDSVFSVNGTHSSAQLSQIAWYWTIIANKVLTTDEINQVIAYYNLDRTLKPDILCNTIKQGITNENHAEFGDRLIDFSGNGRDIQLNNIAWKGDSGIGKYAADFTSWTTPKKVQKTSDTVKITTEYTENWVAYLAPNNTFKSMKVLISGIPDGGYLQFFRTTADGGGIKMVNGINEIPEFTNTVVAGFYIDVPLGFDWSNLVIEQIPSHAGALCLDGVNDFGKVTGMPIYKDYTVVADYERLKINIGVDSDSPILSKSESVKLGAFIFNTISSNGDKVSYSFGRRNIINTDDTIRKIFYQSKYINDGQDINIESTFVDSDKLWLGTYRDSDYRFIAAAIYSLMSFPYSMSEFLIERQLKKHKLGTLYPNMVEFRPVIKANANYKITYYQIDSTNTWKSIKVGDYIVIGAKLAFQITFDNDASELKEVVSPQLSGIIVEKRPSNPGYNIYSYITSKSPQKINITIDEYIRFEDIVQPYPSLFTLIDYDTEEVYSWGSKLKVGARFKGNVVNLLPNMYEWQGNVLYNGEVLNWGINPGVVAKEMVFSWNMPFKYLIDNNEPKCILSPRLLRIPNSSYKILGYIPDISGHGNNGVIHNSAYAEGSGVNEDGSYQLDGVDDFVTIPTLSSGGKQVLMKVNLPRLNEIIYDQRKETNTYTFAILTTPSQIAYDQRNSERITYIDGILNTNIIAEQLMGVTHNIVVINSKANLDNTRSPILGRDINGNNWSRMRIYDFMLFDDISTDNKIKELNEYVGIEAKVELPPYYWDAYGKTNLDADKATIQQRGVAVGDYDLTNTDFAYDKMSGFGGYEFEKFTDTTKWIETKREDGIEVIEKNDYSFTAKKVGTGQYFWDFKNNRIKTLDRDLTVKAISNNNVYIRWEFKYRTAEKPDIDSTIILLIQAMTPNVPITVTLPYKTQEEQTELGVVEGSAYYLFYFDPSDIPVGDEYTVEMLPLYTNGLVYDGITDYSKNANIPALDDFTAIIKREWLKKQGCPLIKGSKVYEGGNGNALLLEWDKAYNFVFYKRTDIMEGELPDNISFITPTNYNGNVITRGSGQDTNGICIAGDGNAGFANMVFYKLILYPKTIPLLQINFLKNLMERDEIIDLNNPIFIKNE